MARPAADSIRVQWTGTGTGTMSLGPAVTGFQAFPANLNGMPISYSIETEDGLQRENGIGTYTATGTTLTRDIVTFSTAGAPTKQNFSAGTKHVRLAGLAHDVIENRATVDPVATDDITDGYLAGRARWLNTATDRLFVCVDDTANAAVWALVPSQAQLNKLDGIVVGPGIPKVGNPFSTSETVTNAMHGQRREWIGTTAGRVTVPDGLAEGTMVEYVIKSTTPNLAPLIFDRPAADASYTVGGPVGCCVLRSGGRALVRQEGDSPPRIEGHFDPVPMAGQNGGASFLLERWLRQPQSGSSFSFWGDRYGLHNFAVAAGDPLIGDSGELLLAQAVSDDAYLTSENVTYAGTELLFGFAMQIDAITGTVIPINLGNHGTGHGLYVVDASDGTVRINVLRAAETNTQLTSGYQIGRPFAGGVAIRRASDGTAYVRGFFDEGRGNRQREELNTTNFTQNWTDAEQIFSIGPTLSSSQSFSGRFFAVTIRDNLNFANVNDARDQARAMLAEMRSYYV